MKQSQTIKKLIGFLVCAMLFVAITPQAFATLITKEANVTTVVAGEEFRYTIYVDYNGTELLSNVEVNDTIPAGVTYVGSSASPAAAQYPTSGSTGESIIWRLGSNKEGAVGTSGGTTTEITVDKKLITDGADIVVTMEVNSTTDDTNLVASALVVDGFDGGDATCGSASPTSQNISAGSSVHFIYNCTVSTGNGRGTVAFDANVSADSNTYATATSHTVIVVPPLSFVVKADNPRTENSVTNSALISSYKPFGIDECYAISDEKDSDTIYHLDLSNAASLALRNATGVTDIEALKFNLDYTVLYAINGNRLGTIEANSSSTNEGQFTALANPIGTVGGALGEITVSDADGMAFDPANGDLYASVCRGGNDLLIKLNTTTGAHIPDAFGSGVDYLEIDFPDTVDANIDDIDGMSFYPDGTLYAIQNNGGSNDYLTIIDKSNGTTTIIDPGGSNGRAHDENNASINDLESLSFMPDGTLYATNGSKNPNGVLYSIDRTNAAMLSHGTIADGGDYEGLSCKESEPDLNQEIIAPKLSNETNTTITPRPNTLTGHIYEETNGNNTQDGADADLSGITVTVTDANGTVFTTTTGSDGNFTVTGLALGDATVTIDTTSTSILNGSTQTEGDNADTWSISLGANTEENNGFHLLENLFTKLSVTEHTPLLAGDTIDYNITLQNNSSSDLTNVNITDVIPDGTTYNDDGQITYWEISYESWLIADNMTRDACTGDDPIDSYTCKDGNVTEGGWNSNWKETGEATDDNKLNIKMVDSGGTGSSDGDALRIRLRNTDRYIQREVNLSQYVEANLSFGYKRDSDSDNNHATFDLKLSSDGTTFDTNATYTVDADDSNYILVSFDITSYISSNTVIRLSQGSISDKEDYIYIDDLKINVKKEIVTQITEDVNITQLSDTNYTSCKNKDINISFSVTVDDPATVTEVNNTATLNADGISERNATTTDPVASPHANLVTKKVVNNETPYRGSTIIYTITVTNNGPAQATGVSLTDQLPSGVTYVSDNSGGSYNSGTGIWTINTLNSGAVAELNITATVD